MKAIALILILLCLSCGASMPPVYPSPSPMLTELPPVNWPITSTLHLPYIACQENPQPRVFDGQGIERDWPWLVQEFGAITYSGKGLSEIHACQGDCPAAHVVKVVDINGAAVYNQVVVWSWPGAPELPEPLRYCGMDVGIWGSTDVNGMIGFAMGAGAWYAPPGGGPHTSWIPGLGCLGGIGMLALTNHDHVDAVWTVQAGAAGDWGYAPGVIVLPGNIVMLPDQH